MANIEAMDVEAKRRVISHMNADHQDSLGRYLEHLNGVSSNVARTAQLTDMTLDTMSLQAGRKRYLIPFDPPMASWREARERLVRMDQDALAGLGRSDITVREYQAPKGFHAVVFALCFFAYIATSRRENWVPGSLFYETLCLERFPAFAKFGYWSQPFILAFMLVIHSVEATVLVRTRLRKHSVPRFSKLWWTWTISCFVEGFGAFQRFDAIVKKAQIQKEKRKH